MKSEHQKSTAKTTGVLSAGFAHREIMPREPCFLAGYPHVSRPMLNGELHGYIVTPEAENANGYESQMSLFPAANGERFVRKTLELIRSLA